MEEYINFKMPQGEIFKQLDGKIRKIVDAHSNYNKLYALNEFSMFSEGPMRPSELPPQLPPPPPWVPKSTSPGLKIDSVISKLHQRRKQQQHQYVRKTPSAHHSSSSTSSSAAAAAALSLSPAASRIMQPISQEVRRFANQRVTVIDTSMLRRPQQPPSSSSSNRMIPSPAHRTTPTIPMRVPNNSTNTTTTNSPSTSALFSVLSQQIKERIESECESKGNQTSDKKSFQENLIGILSEEITAFAKAAEFNFTSQQHQQHLQQTTPHFRPKNNNLQRSLLSKSSPQTLFNTIRRETSLLLKKRDPQTVAGGVGLKTNNIVRGARHSLSLLSDQQGPGFKTNKPKPDVRQAPQPIYNKLQQTIRVVVPPTEFNQNPALKIVNMRSKKCKRNQQMFGLRLSNYMDKETPQPSNERISVEQYAKCLDLVRKNDVSLQRHQQRLSQSESGWRVPLSNRPLRLGRIRGERMCLPVSASYKATRKAGLQ